MRVHENMKRLRERMALSQAAFGKLVGVEEADIIAIEDGRKDIPVSLVYEVAEKAGGDGSVAYGWFRECNICWEI